MRRGEKQQRGPRRVVIVSDDPLFVETVSFGFRAGGDFIVFHCPARMRTQASAIVRAGRDVVLIDDAGMADGALDLVRDICVQVERPAVLVLSREPDRLPTERILRAGATAVISKAIHTGPLLAFVRETLAGRIIIGTTLRASAEVDQPGPDQSGPDLSGPDLSGPDLSGPDPQAAGAGFDEMRLIVAA